MNEKQKKSIDEIKQKVKETINSCVKNAKNELAKAEQERLRNNINFAREEILKLNTELDKKDVDIAFLEEKLRKTDQNISMGVVKDLMKASAKIVNNKVTELEIYRKQNRRLKAICITLAACTLISAGCWFTLI